MRLPRFEYLEPKDVKEMSSLLSEKGKRRRYVPEERIAAMTS